VAPLDQVIEYARSRDGYIVALTGAGISAESGIPTFRGEEGYWTVGSEVYHPQEMATRAAFDRMHEEVWLWYLYRRTVCRAADPNPAHHALVGLEEAYEDRFRLITQNVDGLHLRCGNTLERTYQIHGNIDYMRCWKECSAALYPIPEVIGDVGKEHPFSSEWEDLLVCPKCGGFARPHVLWFDECYDEEHFRWDSSLRASAEAALVIVVGTSASTNLPNHVVRLAAQTGAALVEINIADNPFARVAEALPHGHAIRGTAAEQLPALVERLL
jgi:NAD-dependent deacetylase